ncbi:hypothetical protein [Micromonospora hortensis]|nr:hypothetical protein [Micromonospora hortensis]
MEVAEWALREVVADQAAAWVPQWDGPARMVQVAGRQVDGPPP